MDFTFRNLCSWALAQALIQLGFVRKAKMKALNGDHILSLYSHNPTKDDFESCIKWLIEHNFKFISVNDLQRIAQGKMPFPKGGVMLTVDDGWQSNVTNIVEVAAKYEIPVAIFVTTEPVENGVYWWSYLKCGIVGNPNNRIEALKRIPNQERVDIINSIKQNYTLPREAMTIEQVKSVSRVTGITIGGHTHSHPILTNCDAPAVYQEVKVCKKKLESWINKEVACFAYPNGDYGQREVEALKKTGYTMAFANRPAYLTKDSLSAAYDLPRIGLLEGASLAENICRMMGVWHPTVLRLKKFFKRSASEKVESVQFTAPKVSDGILE